MKEKFVLLDLIVITYSLLPILEAFTGVILSCKVFFNFLLDLIATIDFHQHVIRVLLKVKFYPIFKYFSSLSFKN